MNIPRPRFVHALLTSLLVLTAGCPAGDDDDDVPDGPHALAAVSIGEAHAATGGTASASVAAMFVPDADAAGAGVAPSCTREVAGCELPLQPDCGGTCGDREYCTFDGDCDAVCKRACDAECGAGEECYFPTPDAPSCRQRQSFDAGSITITGTTTPVTLFPPYSFAGVDDGSLYLEGAVLAVNAAGATGAGYAAFAESFTATRLVRSQPPLDELGLLDVFGDGDVPVGWIPGEDEITIAATVTGLGGGFGTLRCAASDADGSFALPREAIDAALDGDGLDTLSISITRTRTERVYDLATTGELAGTTIQPTGWLELATVSSESHAFEGCEGNEQLCDEACVDTDRDAQHCGDCETDCPGSDTCEQGTCQGDASCNSCAEDVSSGNGACADLFDACTDTADCAALRTCFTGCTNQTCINTCFDDHPEGATVYQDWAACICGDSCSLACAC
jgi:hypothetical protein